VDSAWGVSAMPGRADLAGEVAASRRLVVVAAGSYWIWRWPRGPSAPEFGQVWWAVVVVALNGSGSGRSSWWIVLVVAGSSLRIHFPREMSFPYEFLVKP
jgi:hypothetical protein